MHYIPYKEMYYNIFILLTLQHNKNKEAFNQNIVETKKWLNAKDLFSSKITFSKFHKQEGKVRNTELQSLHN